MWWPSGNTCGRSVETVAPNGASLTAGTDLNQYRLRDRDLVEASGMVVARRNSSGKLERNHGDSVTGMALIVFLRGVNVGGHRTFRPSILARELSDYDVVNVGAAGTFIVRKPGSRGEFRAELLRKLPFEAEVVLCEGRNLIRLETENPFGTEPSRPDIVRFVSILSRAGRLHATLPVTFPPDGEWLVRVIASNKQFVFGMYRRHMKTLSHLRQTTKLFSCR